MGGDHGNFISGRWRSVGAGEGYVVADVTGKELTRRPRSSAGDLEEALGALEGASHALWDRSPGERKEMVEAMDLGRGFEVCAGPLGARIGVEAGRAKKLLEDDLTELQWMQPDAAAGPGVALVRAAPTALLSGLVPLVARALEGGRCVLLLADPILPWMAEAVAAAWECAGGEGGALAVLHDDGATTARSVLGSGRLSGVLARDHPERLVELEAATLARGTAGFGTGVVESKHGGASFEGFEVKDTTAMVTRDLDPEEEAAAICDAAFGSAEALGGEREGSVGRVVCHEALFSHFTEAFLKRFDLLKEALGPLGASLQAGRDTWVEELVQSAVGDGATCLRGGPSDSIQRGRRGKINRSVFTNVGPNWRLARACRPAPALALMRASSDAEVHELALACDAGPQGGHIRP